MKKTFMIMLFGICQFIITNQVFSQYECLQYGHSRIFFNTGKEVVAEWVYPESVTNPVKFGQMIQGFVRRMIMAGEYAGCIQEIEYNGGVIVDGTYESVKPDGTVCYSEEYSGGYINGIRKVFYPSGGLKSKAEYKGSVPEGRAESYDEEGRLLEIANYRAGKRNGPSTYFSYDRFREKTEIKCIYEGGIVNGEFEIYNAKGSMILKGKYENGSPAGEFSVFLPGGFYNKIPAKELEKFYEKNFIKVRFSEPLMEIMR